MKAELCLNFISRCQYILSTTKHERFSRLETALVFMAPFRGSNFKSKITTSYKVLWMVFLRGPLFSITCGRAPTKSFRSSSWTTLPASAMVQLSHFLAAKTRSGTVNIKVMLSFDLNVVNINHWKRQFYFEGHYIGIWKANHLTVFSLKLHILFHNTENDPLELSSILSWRRWNWQESLTGLLS